MQLVKPIKASYRWTVDELATAQVYHNTITGRRNRWMRYGGLIIMLGVTLIMAIFKGQFSWAIFALVGVTYLAVMISEVNQHPKMVHRAAVQAFANRPDKNKVVHFEFDDQAILSGTEGMGESTIQWDDVTKVIETRSGFLFYLKRQMYIWVPEEAIKPQSDIGRLRELVQEKIDNYINEVV